MYVVGYILICFGRIVFNEIFIFYFFGLHENTKREIIARAKKIMRLIESFISPILILYKYI